jgi:hypothetical protein
MINGHYHPTLNPDRQASHDLAGLYALSLAGQAGEKIDQAFAQQMAGDRVTSGILLVLPESRRPLRRHPQRLGGQLWQATVQELRNRFEPACRFGGGDRHPYGVRRVVSFLASSHLTIGEEKASGAGDPSRRLCEFDDLRRIHTLA